MTLTTIFYFSVIASSLSVVIPIGFSLAQRNNYKDGALTALKVFLFTSAASDLICYILMMMHQMNIVIINTFFLLQFLLFSWMYAELFKKRENKLIRIITIAFLVLFLINSIWGQSFLDAFQTITNATSSSILIGYSIGFYFFINYSDHNLTSYQFKLFSIINAAIFIYFLVGVCFMTFNSCLFSDWYKIEPIENVVINNANNTMKNLLLAYGLYWAGKKGLN